MLCGSASSPHAKTQEFDLRITAPVPSPRDERVVFALFLVRHVHVRGLCHARHKTTSFCSFTAPSLPSPVSSWYIYQVPGIYLRVCSGLSSFFVDTWHKKIAAADLAGEVRLCGVFCFALFVRGVELFLFPVYDTSYIRIYQGDVARGRTNRTNNDPSKIAYQGWAGEVSAAAVDIMVDRTERASMPDTYSADVYLLLPLLLLLLLLLLLYACCCRCCWRGCQFSFLCLLQS